MPNLPQKSATESFCESPRHVRGLSSQWRAEWCAVDTSDVDFTWKLHVLEDPTPPPGYSDGYPKDYYDYFPAKTSGFDFSAAISLANAQSRPSEPYATDHYDVTGYNTPAAVSSDLRLIWNPETETSSDPGSPTSVSLSSIPPWWDESRPGEFFPTEATQSYYISPQLSEFAWPFSLYGHNPAYGAPTAWQCGGFRQCSVKCAQRTWVKFDKRVRGIWIDADWYASPNVFTGGSQVSGWNIYDTEYSWVTGGRYWFYFALATCFFPKNFRFIDYAIIAANEWIEIPIPEVLTPGSLSDGYLGRIRYLVIGETPGAWSGRTGIAL